MHVRMYDDLSCLVAGAHKHDEEHAGQVGDHAIIPDLSRHGAPWAESSSILLDVSDGKKNL